MSPQRNSEDRAGATGHRSEPASWIAAPARRSTGKLLWESVTDIADTAAIRRWRPSVSRTETRGESRPWGRGNRSAAEPDTARRARHRAVRPLLPSWAVLTGLRRWVQAGLVTPALYASVRLDIGGLEEFDRLHEPAVLVANHASHLDTPAVLAALPASQRSRTAVAVPGQSPIAAGWRAAVTALLFNAVRQPTPTNRQKRERVLADSNLLLFSEGTRSADGFPAAFEADAARLALETGRSMMPVGIRGSYAAMPRGQSWPSSGRPRVAVRFGPPLRPAAGESAEEFTERTRVEVERLISEDITSWWDAQSDAGAGSRSEPPAGSWRRRWQQSRSAEPGKALPRRKIWKR